MLTLALGADPFSTLRRAEQRYGADSGSHATIQHRSVGAKVWLAYALRQVNTALGCRGQRNASFRHRCHGQYSFTRGSLMHRSTASTRIESTHVKQKRSMLPSQPRYGV